MHGTMAWSCCHGKNSGHYQEKCVAVLSLKLGEKGGGTTEIESGHGQVSMTTVVSVIQEKTRIFAVLSHQTW